MKMKIKKRLLIVMIVVAVIVVIAAVFTIILGQDSRVTNDLAEKDVNGRYITIINNTNQIINEVHITVGDGTEIESMRQTNPDEISFSIEIPKQYSDYTTFTVTLIDRYNMKYQKNVDILEMGRTEVKINEDDYIKQKGDFWNKVDKFLTETNCYYQHIRQNADLLVKWYYQIQGGFDLFEKSENLYCNSFEKS